MRDEDIGGVLFGPIKNDLIELRKGQIAVLVKNNTPPLFHDPWILEGVEADRFIMNYKKLIARREDPEERVEHWECLDDDGVYSFEKQEKILFTRRDRKGNYDQQSSIGR